MKGIILTLIFMLGLVRVYAQDQQNRYELIMGKYSYGTEFQVPVDIEKSCPIRIDIPKYTITVSNIYPDGTEIITYDTVDHFLLTTILDSLTVDSAAVLFSSPVWLNWNDYEVDVCGVSIVAYRPEGFPQYAYFKSSDISTDAEWLECLRKCPVGSYIVINSVCFVPDMTKHREKKWISEKLGFKIIAGH